MGLSLETRNMGCENGSKRRRVKYDASPKKLPVKDIVLIFLYILPSWLRVVFIMKSRIQFFYRGTPMCTVHGTRLAMSKTICMPNASSSKTGSGATEGGLD